VDVIVRENEAIVAAATKGSETVEYWVRCLPSDFPFIRMVSYPEAGSPTPGYYLVGDQLPDRAVYAMILDGNGVPVWYQKGPSTGIADVDHVVDGGISYISVLGADQPAPFRLFRLQPYTETPVAPTADAATGAAPLDIHELRVAPNGDYVALVWPIERADMTGLSVTVGGATVALGKDTPIIGCNVVEFASSGTVTWVWKATEHFDPRRFTVWPVAQAYDPVDAGPLDGATPVAPFHCNSVDVDPENGNLLVSARQANSFFYLERDGGNVDWKLGGTDASSLDNTVYMAAPSTFVGQHDVRLQPGWSTCAGGRVSMYDDQTGTTNPARALVLDVSLGGKVGCTGGIPPGATPSASVASEYAGTAPAAAAGSVRVEADTGSLVIGWGLSLPRVFTEVNAKREKMLDLESMSMESYRAIKVPLTALSLDAMRATAGLPAPDGGS
jgi:hypothetical protein